MRRLNVDVDNTPFLNDSEWFMDALVLNWAKNKTYLNKLFEKITMKANHDLKSYKLRDDVDDMTPQKFKTL